MSIHDGHRNRLKKRFLLSGMDMFERHNALELLLFYSKPRGDTNPTAHELINTFGSFANVFNASIEDLCTVKGVGQNSALLIKLIPELCKMYEVDAMLKGTIIHSSNDICDYFNKLLQEESTDNIYIVCMDNKNKILGCVRSEETDIEQLSQNPKTLFEMVFKYNASTAVIANRHKGGLETISDRELPITYSIYRMLQTVEVNLIDQILFVDKLCLSIRSIYNWPPVMKM